MDTQVQNFPLPSANDQFSVLWKMTRVMKRAGFRYKASGDGNVIKDTTGNPANDLWGGGIIVGTQTGAAAMTISSPTTTAYGGRTTISGMTGAAFSASSVGNFLTITGATNGGNNGTFLITNYISATSVKIENPSAVAETTPGIATWREVSALNDVYPALATGAWLVLQGPSTLKVPIGTSTPSGNFLKGENVTQATTGATGEIIGVLIDQTNGGYLVIAPRLSGTGAGVRGWDGAHAITGAISGVSASPSGTVIEYVREIVFWKSNNLTQGHIYHQVIDSVGESLTTATQGRFSTMAALGTCTATICPGGASGGNPTSNGFPTTGTFTALGTGGSNAATTGASYWSNSSTASVYAANGHIFCANAIEDANTSADGSTTWAIGTPGNATSSYIGGGFLRLDDQEDGDVDPYVWAVFANSSWARARTGGAAVTGSSDMFNYSIVNTTSFMGFRRRGFVTNESFSEFVGTALSFQGPATNWLNSQNTATPDRVACAFTTVNIRDPIWIICANGNNSQIKTRKGTLRWWYLVSCAGNGGDTLDGKKWVQLSSANAALVIGPADGVTQPTNN